MVSFAELKAKAEKAKDASVTAVSNTRDRYSSTPSSKVNWDPNWKRAPPPPIPSPASASAGHAAPPPPPSRIKPDVVATEMAPFVVYRGSRPTHGIQDAGAPPYVPPPPPARAVSGYPPHRLDLTSIDWVHLSAEDKEAFFGWLDEFFSGYLGIEVGPGGGRVIPLRSSVVQESVRPPLVNLATRPRA